VPRRYQNPLYTYRRIVGAADYLAAQGLIHHAKAKPGQRGWQSAMKATPELVERTNCIIEAGPPLITAKPAEVIILRGRGMPVDYTETKFTQRRERKLSRSMISLATQRCWAVSWLRSAASSTKTLSEVAGCTQPRERGRR
jgi:hypothetical protein